MAGGRTARYAATGDEDAFGPIEATRRDSVEFGAVIVDDDRLLLPERGEDGRGGDHGHRVRRPAGGW